MSKDPALNKERPNNQKLSPWSQFEKLIDPDLDIEHFRLLFLLLAVGIGWLALDPSVLPPSPK